LLQVDIHKKKKKKDIIEFEREWLTQVFFFKKKPKKNFIDKTAKTQVVCSRMNPEDAMLLH